MNYPRLLKQNIINKIIYHYTTLDALVNGIISVDTKGEKKVCLRATNCRYLNDPKEMFIGSKFHTEFMRKKLSEYTKIATPMEFVKNYDDNYLISFSLNRDSLPMWTTYGNNGQGIAIGFHRFEHNDTNLLLKCIYDVNDFARDYNNLQENEQIMLQFLFPLLIKHNEYKYEKEVRYIGDFSDIDIKFRYKKGLAIPYKEIHFPTTQIHSIIIGPAVNQEMVKHSLRFYLDHHGLEHVKLYKSTIPYRDL